jgi:hypothetical protein
MDVQSAPPPYMQQDPTQQSVSGTPPRLGPQVPGFAGGLPTNGGLSVLFNPMAEQLRNMGRDEDSMLVHMTPNEVNSLQGLAQAAGGSLTVNPNTGLPEAGFLKKLLPTLLGVGLNFVLPGSGLVAQLGGKAVTAGLMTAAGATALTGSLQKGLMAGLGAYGGASLAGGIQGALGGAAAPNAATSAATAATPSAAAGTDLAAQLSQAAAGNVAPPVATNAAGSLSQKALGTALRGGAAATPTGAISQAALNTAMAGGAPGLAAPTLATTAMPAVAPAAAPRGLAGFMQGFSDTARGTMGGLGAKLATPMAATGVLGTASDLTTPSGMTNAQGAVDNSYAGPYYSQQRRPRFAESTDEILGSSAERDYFDVDVPEIYNVSGQLVQPGTNTAPGTMITQNIPNPRARKGQPMYTQRMIPYMGLQQEEQGYARGGTVDLADGSFVVDARTVSEIGNGSSNAGHEVLAQMGGRPVRGPGDGVSDSIPARIGRDQPARVARDEVVFPPEAVRRVGRGDERRGADKLYALMKKAHKARSRSERGKDTGLRRGLA